MKKFIAYFLEGAKYFIIQTFGEVILITILMYLGLPYSEMSVGNEHFYEVIIAILGFHAFFKILIYGWLYLGIFITTCIVKKYGDNLHFSIINAILSMLLPIIILFLRQLSFLEMKSVFIATFVTSVLIILFVLVIKNRSLSKRPF